MRWIEEKKHHHKSSFLPLSHKFQSDDNGDDGHNYDGELSSTFLEILKERKKAGHPVN